MCAIAGIIDYKTTDSAPKDVCDALLSTMRRRGPDQTGVHHDGAATLLHARLSVVDLDGGRQPFCLTYQGESYRLVYNGELYNTEELRRELTALGHTFHETSDTEVLLHAYAQWGADCLPRLNGIFAFAVWEHRAERLFIARDSIGVKPFFYSRAGGMFLFASEIKTLLAHPAVTPRVNRDGLLELMLIGPGRTPGCGVFSGIEELRPAHCGYCTKDGLSLWQYARLTDRVHDASFEDTVEQVRYLVQDAITRQLRADVPVCTLLSGGLDSSIISAIAARYFRERGEKLHTFSVSYRDNAKYFKAGKFQPTGDDHYIEVMQKHLGSVHHNIVLDSEDVAEALYDAVLARDLPGMADVDSSLLLFCRAIKKHATVVLSGECADEIFGGYPWYRDKTIRERDGFPWAQSTAYRAGFLQPGIAGVHDAEDFVAARYRATIADTSVLPCRDTTERRMREMVRLNMDWFMQTLLDRKDRMSMYSGLEVRVPFCDRRIAEYLYTVPWEYKDYQGREKGLLRMAAADLLPEEVLHRKKSPYPKTHHPAYLAAVSRMLRRVLDGKDAPILSFLRRDALQALLDGTRDESVPWYGQLMNRPQTIAYLVQLNYWLEAYHVEVSL